MQRIIVILVILAIGYVAGRKLPQLGQAIGI